MRSARRSGAPSRSGVPSCDHRSVEPHRRTRPVIARRALPTRIGARSLAVLGSVLAVVTLSAGASRQQPSFSTKIESVRVDVLVLDGGRPVRGLGPADFEIADNGVPQQVDLVSVEQIPLNVVLSLDMSDSLAGERLEQLRDASRAVLDGLTRDDQAALVTFSHAIALGSPLSKDVPAVRAALDDALGVGQTSLVDGVYAAITIGESDVGRALLIVFSDGLDTSSWLQADSVLEVAKRSDVVAYSAAVGTVGGAPFLKELSALTGGTTYRVESTRDLRATFLGILDEFRHRYLVSYTPRGVARDGWHKLDVRVRNRRVTVKARPGYVATSR
jgi:VWFA-related protein